MLSPFTRLIYRTQAQEEYLSVFLSFCLSVFLSFCLSVFLSFCLSVDVSLSLCLYFFLYVISFLPLPSFHYPLTIFLGMIPTNHPLELQFFLLQVSTSQQRPYSVHLTTYYVLLVLATNLFCPLNNLSILSSQSQQRTYFVLLATSLFCPLGNEPILST